MGIKAMITSFFNKILGRSTIEQAVGVKTVATQEMADAIELWSLMYLDNPPWVNDNVKSLGLPAAIASEIARLTTIEMQSQITGGARAEYLNEQYSCVLKDLRRYVEYGCALGGLVLKPYISGSSVVVDYVLPNNFFPVAFDSKGNITDIIFTERKWHGDMCYTRLERHTKTPGGCRVTNKAYRSYNASQLGTEIPLEYVAEWATLKSEAEIQNTSKLLLGYFKPTQANAIDPTSPLGVSVYSRAVDLVKEADKQYSRLLWEFEGGELAIDADVSLFSRDQRTGKLRLPKGKERLFRALNVDTMAGAKQLDVFAPELRDRNIINGLNQILQRIEDVCGLARGTFSDPNQEAKTATEIKLLNQRSYSTVADTQKALQFALNDLIYAMDVWATLGNLAPAGKYDVSYEWDDSIIVDAQSEQAIRMQEVAAGLLKREHYIMWRYGCSEEEAMKMLPDKVSEFD